ncbi:MAG: DUF883 domain-containing protein [Verrucomicrobiae bacterium]|nr:DUF883 domain-containing protein [Verrucomicrobiae bacterium]
MSQPTKKTEEYLIDDLHEGVRELGSMTNDTATRLGEKAVQAIRRLEKAIPSVKARFNGWTDQARHAGRHLDDYAHENPWRVIGTALGAGVVLGMLLLSGGDDDANGSNGHGE